MEMNRTTSLLGIFMVFLAFSANLKALTSLDSAYYYIKVDTAGVPATDGGLGYLLADTLTENRKDSLTVVLLSEEDRSGNDLSLWSFCLDTVKSNSDTAYYRIRNKATDSLLAFNRPTMDTVACVRDTGELNLWLLPIPPLVEDQKSGLLVLRDTIHDANYYLGLRDDRVMLLTDTMDYTCMRFVLEEKEPPYVPDSCIAGADSAKVFRVKYVNGTDSGKYLGVDFRGNKILLDTVYAHLPDGQFVVYQRNKYTWMSRAGYLTTGRSEQDSLKVVFDDSNDTIPDWYTNTIDTFEITPITDWNTPEERLDSTLGYRYFLPDELLTSSYVFSYTSADTLNGRVIGYDEADSLVRLLPEGDTARFVLEIAGSYPIGAPAIGDIPRLERWAYRLCSTEDTTLYLAVRADSLAMDTLPKVSRFFLKEDTIPGNGYYFIEDSLSQSIVRKVLTDSTRHFNVVPIDSADTHLFALIRKDRYIPEADPYNYLKELVHGRGLYEFSAQVVGANRFLTRNYYHYAVFGKEGESMLRSGSYAPVDFQLWVDTARGRGHDANKPSFFLISEVDTLQSSPTSRLNVSGYFLHVMDSISQPSPDDYVIRIDGRRYRRVNFVKAKRHSANELLLDALHPQARDSVGFAGKNEGAIDEYRFYLQAVDEDAAPDEYYLVTEQGYGGKRATRGYLSYKYNHRDSLYVGPRLDPSKADESEGRMISLKVTKASTVSNETVPSPPEVEEEAKKMTVIGGNSQIKFLYAAGERVRVYNVVGQQIADRVIASDQETIAVSRGILIVRIGDKMTRKVVVR